MVHFPGLALRSLCIQLRVTSKKLAGFPHSEISGSRDVCSSPELIAACHVLHRLHAPRHPPCALSSLTIKFAQSKLPLRRPVRTLKTNYFLANYAQLTCACFPNIVISESPQITYSVVKQQFTVVTGKVTIIHCPNGLSTVTNRKPLMN